VQPPWACAPLGAAPVPNAAAGAAGGAERRAGPKGATSQLTWRGPGGRGVLPGSLLPSEHAAPARCARPRSPRLDIVDLRRVTSGRKLGSASFLALAVHRAPACANKPLI